MITGTWTEGIEDLIETLTCRVRVLSLNHIQQGWNGEFGEKKVIPVIAQLVMAELLVGDIWNSPASPITDEPIAEWSPGQPEPDLLSIEQYVQSRWQGPLEQTPVVAATHKAARLFGSSTGGLPPDNHRNHDMLLAGVFLRYRNTRPDLAAAWLGEDGVALAERCVKNPDAFLIDKDGSVIRVIESTGRYSLDQLESFHRHCKLSALPYELW